MKRLIHVVLAIATIGLILPAATVSVAQTNTVDIRVWTETTEGQPVYDACYQLAGYSNIGCDENRDGNVYFEAIPYGNYELISTNQNETGYNIQPMGIVVNGVNTDFLVMVDTAPIQAETTDVLLLTRDPETGESLTDVCYELVGYSNIGCDENEDGRVSFADIPFGTYTIRQTTWPNGYERINDYQVEVFHTPHSGPFTVLLAQADEQAAENHTNYSVVFYDTLSGQLIENDQNCAQFGVRGADPISAVGCDEDITDGQVDFMGVNITQQHWSSHHELSIFPACGFQATDMHFKIVGDSTVIWMVALTATGERCG